MEGAGLYMTIEEMRELLTKDEKITVEYKAWQNGIHDDVYETVCSFSNRYGGYIIIGVEDGGKPELFEDDVFKITIPLNKEAAKEASDQKKLSDREQAIYNLICENKHLTVEQVMAEFDISRATVFRDYAKIKKITGAVYDKNESVWKL